MMCWSEEICDWGIVAGALPIPTIDNTPGTTRIGSLSWISNLQNKYQGNNGVAMVFSLSDQRRVDLDMQKTRNMLPS
jgi:hypothetical protein